MKFRSWMVVGLIVAFVAAVGTADAANAKGKNAGKKPAPAKTTAPKPVVKPTEVVGTIAVTKDASGFPSAKLTAADGTVYTVKNAAMVEDKDGKRIKAICNAPPTVDGKTKKHSIFIDQVTAAPSF